MNFKSTKVNELCIGVVVNTTLGNVNDFIFSCKNALSISDTNISVSFDKAGGEYFLIRSNEFTLDEQGKENIKKIYNALINDIEADVYVDVLLNGFIKINETDDDEYNTLQLSYDELTQGLKEV